MSNQRGRTRDSRQTAPCTETRTLRGFKFPCWYRYEQGQGWSEEPHQHWFKTIDDHGNEVTVTWTTPDGPAIDQPLFDDES